MKPPFERSFYLHNFGCKVNQEEGGALANRLLAAGWRQCLTPDAGLIIVNSCTVTQEADRKVRSLLRRLAKTQPASCLAVCGCYAQRAAAELAELGILDIIAGVEERRDLPALAEELFCGQRRPTDSPLILVSEVSRQREFRSIAPESSQSRARAYLKIEDGCDQFCHYCVIPYVRGPVRSLPPDQALEHARRLLAAGHREIVLTGIHIGAYGQDLPAAAGALPELIRELCALPGLLRLRLGSVEPQQFTPALLEVIAGEPKLCPHLHIPLQSGCDRTLNAMGRRYDTAFYADLLDRLRGLLPDPAFTTDVMVGFPGETEADFAQSQAFCRACGFADLHIFPYSRRSGTPAAERRDQVRQTEKARRAGELAAAARELAASYARRWLHRPLTMLVEETAEIAGRTWLRGHSDNYLTLLLPPDASGSTVRTVEATAITPHGLLVQDTNIEKD